MLTLLLKNQSQPALTLWIPPSKQLALREITYTISTGLQKNMKNTELRYYPKHSPVTYLKALIPTYPITMTPYKHTCIPSAN